MKVKPKRATETHGARKRKCHDVLAEQHGREWVPIFGPNCTAGAVAAHLGASVAQQ